MAFIPFGGIHTFVLIRLIWIIIFTNQNLDSIAKGLEQNLNDKIDEEYVVYWMK
jgi:hypothetical protein